MYKRQVLEEFGTELPDSKTVRVHDSNADMRYLVLPQQPEGTDGWSADRLAEIVTRDAMVGVVRLRLDIKRLRRDAALTASKSGLSFHRIAIPVPVFVHRGDAFR